MGGIREMRQGPTSEDSAVESKLFEWRYRVINIFLFASALFYVPAMALFITGQGAPIGWPVKIAAAALYLILLFFALLRRINYTIRAWVILICGYAMAVLLGLADAQSPFARALPIVMPIFTIVLLGLRAGWFATAVSALLVLFVPLLHTMPGLHAVFASNPAEGPISLGLALTQATALMAILFAPMLLFDRFLHFLMQSLARLEREAVERSAAYRKLEYEIKERRRLEREVTRASDEERDRLGREIHDGVCQQLTGALLRSEALARRLRRDETLAVEDLSQLSSLIEETIDEAHAVAQGLCSLHPEPEALSAALRTLAKRSWEASGIPCLFEAEGDVNVSESTTAQHLYRIAQEALSNAARHAHAQRISVTLQGDEEGLFLNVEDDGDGVLDGMSSVGMGFRTMAYRASLLEGKLEVTQAPTGGTRVSCRVPRGRLIRLDKQR